MPAVRIGCHARAAPHRHADGHGQSSDVPGGALRDLARAQTAQHVRFHASTAGLLLARLRRYAATGTTWYAPIASRTPLGTGW